MIDSRQDTWSSTGKRPSRAEAQRLVTELLQFPGPTNGGKCQDFGYSLTDGTLRTEVDRGQSDPNVCGPNNQGEITCYEQSWVSLLFLLPETPPTEAWASPAACSDLSTLRWAPQALCTPRLLPSREPHTCLLTLKASCVHD